LLPSKRFQIAITASGEFAVICGLSAIPAFEDRFTGVDQVTPASAEELD
jgi:hypothetical protein